MRYVIIEKEMGLFCGSIEKYAIFAKHDYIRIDKVVSFESEKDAVYCVENYLKKTGCKFSIKSIDTDKTYVPIVEIIKNGLGDYTHNMIDNLYMPSISIH